MVTLSRAGRRRALMASINRAAAALPCQHFALVSPPRLIAASKSACAPRLFDPPAGGHSPDRVDAAAARRDDLLVQVHGRIGIADDEFDLVADLRRRARLL